MSDTKIEWADRVWNPVTGCTEVSPGCDHCYAKTFAERWRGVPGHPYENGFDLTLRPHRLSDPHTWRAGQRVFVNSMSDLFHRDVPAEFIVNVFAVMKIAETHTFQMLTKRPERMRRLVPAIPESFIGKEPWPLQNVHLGVSIESNEYAWRADMLRETPAAVRWISAEPLLGPLDRVDLTGIDWVVVGGESGPGARPMALEWAYDVVERCRAAGIPVFCKQLGKVAGKALGAGSKGGDIAAFPESLRVREFPRSVGA